jgi:hypothetical protein
MPCGWACCAALLPPPCTPSSMQAAAQNTYEPAPLRMSVLPHALDNVVRSIPQENRPRTQPARPSGPRSSLSRRQIALATLSESTK